MEAPGREFIEVETPMMHPIPGGAAARPFVTHHNALDLDMYLRIAPELYLKRLIVGGLGRVYEINRNFRNEGVSATHNPEFTMLEFYWAYADYNDAMALTETMFRELSQAITGGSAVTYQGQELDFSGPYERMSVEESVRRHNPKLADADLWDPEFLRTACAALQIHTEKSWGAGRLLTGLFEATVEARLVQPTFITHYPTEVSPLSRRNDSDPFLTDRFEFFVGGRELANGFSELNDADDQAARFREQAARKAGGDEEAMFYDADYIRTLEYGLPPTAGLGIGIDRTVMLLTNQPSIRDVLLFPHMRPE
jgi:lysyl-tRNA synthetase class 2